MSVAKDRFELTDLVNKLFIHTDYRRWDKLKNEVFTKEVWFDMSSLGGGEPKRLSVDAICAMWNEGFAELDAVHHQAGHYLMKIDELGADIFAYAVAQHYKKSARKGNTRSFTGSYDLHAVRTIDGWRLDSFKYNLKFIDGNQTLD